VVKQVFCDARKAEDLQMDRTTVTLRVFAKILALYWLTSAAHATQIYWTDPFGTPESHGLRRNFDDGSALETLIPAVPHPR
jgi:hypothetical protein